MMEPPSKRLRVGQAPYNEDDDEEEENQDELSLSATQFAARQDPNYQFTKKAAKSATRLKSAFEDIFEKYEKDFTGVGDEIDLWTGEVIVDNGHLVSLGEEGNRTRESSISSDEEERILRGKDIAPAKQSHSKSLVRSNSSTHMQVSPLRTASSRPISSNGGAYGLSSLAFPPNAFGGPNPFMFGSPGFGNNSAAADPAWQAPELSIPMSMPIPMGMAVPPFHSNNQVGQFWQASGLPMPMPMPMSPFHSNNTVDPMWQTPELPMATFQNGFNFPHQAMGYPQPVYGNGLFHHSNPKRLVGAKPFARKTLPRVTSAEDESDDDILLGTSDQFSEAPAVKDTTKSSTLSIVAGNARPTAQEKGTEQATTAETKHTPQKHRRKPRRPKKSANGEELPELGKETAKENRASTPTGLNSKVSKSTSTDSPGAKSIPLPPPRKVLGDVTPTSQVAVEKGEMKVQDTDNVELPDSEQRRSSRARKQIEFYASISWMKRGQHKLDTTEASDAIARIASKPPSPPPARVNKSPKRVKSSKPTKRGNDDGAEQKEEPGQASNKIEASQVAENATRNGDHHDDELHTDLPNPDKEETTVHKSISPSLCTDDTSLDPFNVPGATPSSRELNYPLSSRIEVQIRTVSSHDNENSPHKQFDTISLADNDSQASLDLGHEIHTNQENDETSNLDNRVTGDIPVIVDGDLPSREVSEDRDLGVSGSQRNPECEPAPNIHEDTTEIPAAQTDSAEADNQSPRPAQEPESLPKSSSTEQELEHGQVVSAPDLEAHKPNPPSSPEQTIPQPAPKPSKSPSPKKRQPRATGLALRLLRKRTDEITKPTPNNHQSLNQDPTKSSAPPSHRPAHQSPIPQTPKRRKEPPPSSTTPRTSDHRTRTPHSARKYALASLVPDDPADEDELTLATPTYSPSSFRAKLSRAHARASAHVHDREPPTPSTPISSSGGNAFRRHSLFADRSGSRTPASRKHASAIPPATDSRAWKSHRGSGGGGVKRKFAAVQSSPLARTVADNLLGRGRPASPTEELVRSPAGSVRRCGVDGFVCERDFCFTCCR
ncbi:hypothetical protein F5B20DRAFT_588078 [Whalleya microplaca]|nr:hypothetical protein F5B20DRAFT_588078 [Whalleya microplaca]